MNQRLKSFVFLFLLFAIAIEHINPCFADTAISETELSKAINGIITAREHPFLKQRIFTHRADAIDALYKATNYQLIWLTKPNSKKLITDALDLLDNATLQGLSPINYDSAVLREKSKSVMNLATTEYGKLALFDTALSITVIRMLHDLHYGRVNPKELHYNLKLRDKKQLDIPKIISDGIKNQTIQQLAQFCEPKLTQYEKLKAALATYKKLDTSINPLTFTANANLKIGEKNPQLQELSSLLQALGDLPESEANDADKILETYSPKLDEALHSFQLRHGLPSSGSLNPSTVAALNTPISVRIKQIELAMERLRWLPEITAPSKLVIVNISAFQLWAIENNAETELSITQMRVVVGKALKNQTPILIGYMSYIEIMPYWNVPKKILTEEILPKLSKNSRYLNAQNMEIVASTSNAAKPIPFSSASLDLLKKGALRVRQRPGAKNSLGKIKFIFPNKEDVYLHDTPAVSLFSKSRRDFSHGCVRVAEPITLAEFALKNQDNWNRKAIESAIKTNINQHIDLAHPIPVLLFYSTALVDQNNKLSFYPDIYNHDTLLAEALKQPYDQPEQVFFTSTNTTPITKETVLESP